MQGGRLTTLALYLLLCHLICAPLFKSQKTKALKIISLFGGALLSISIIAVLAAILLKLEIEVNRTLTALITLVFYVFFLIIHLLDRLLIKKTRGKEDSKENYDD